MEANHPLAVIGVFNDSQDAQQAILELQRAGFSSEQIGVAARNVAEPLTTEVQDLRRESHESFVAEGAVTGVAAGAGLGALTGLAILSGVLPPIGPAIAAGTLTVILSSAAAGAAAMGIAGALAGMGVGHEEAEFYETEFHQGRIVVAVTAGQRDQEARAILRRFGAYDMADQAATSERPPASAATFSAGETHTPVAMPMEPGVPAQVNLHGEPLEVPVLSEDLAGDDPAHARRSTINVPVREGQVTQQRNP
jgi:hypothetical protein